MYINYKTCSHLILNLHSIIPKKILHVGAHTGEEAIDYSTNGVEQVIWFEANEDIIPTLNLHLSKFKLKQQIIPLALWDKAENKNFKITNNQQSSSLYDLRSHKEHYPSIKVTEEKIIRTFRLDTLIDHENLLIFKDFDFINIDTQGAELNILKGMGSYLKSESIKGIYLEVNKEFLYEGIPLIGEIDSYLNDFGFSRLLTYWTSQGWGDALYIKRKEILEQTPFQ
jgi:FkbM family methyltransferase